MGTRGAFGVVIGEEEKIGYNQFDSYPDGKGVDNLRWLRAVVAADALGMIRVLAEKAKVVDDQKKPTAAQIKKLLPYANLGVSEQSTDDWYCLTHETHGDIGKMLECGYIEDHRTFPLDSLFCEWAYIVDFDRDVFEIYKGLQKKLPKKGRWAGRPTAEEDTANYKDHLYWCIKSDLEPWQPETSDYKAVRLIASYDFDNLPSDDVFLGEKVEVSKA